MAIFQEVVTSLPWWRLVPDQDHELITAGFGTFKEVSYVSAARSEDRSFALAYLPEGKTITVDLARLSGKVTATWIDPTDGKRSEAATAPAPGEKPGAKVLLLTPPPKNAAGDRDFVLLLTIPFRPN